MNRFDEAVSASDEKLRKDWELGGARLLEAIRAAREGREPYSDQYILWRL